MLSVGTNPESGPVNKETQQMPQQHNIDEILVNDNMIVNWWEDDVDPVNQFVEKVADQQLLQPIPGVGENVPRRRHQSPLDLSSIYRKNPRVIYLLRGVSGSGKTTLASILSYSYIRWGFPIAHFEADQFLIDPSTGSYKADPEGLREAHEACQKAVEDTMSGGVVVIVSNPFVARAHLEPYLRMAKKFSYAPLEIICRGNFPNIHGITPEAIRKMKQNFEVSS